MNIYPVFASIPSACLLAVLLLWSSFACGQHLSGSQRSAASPDVAVVDQLASRVQVLEASVAALQNSLTSAQTRVAQLERNVAFYVSFLNETVTPDGRGDFAKFDNVTLNEGDGYSPRAHFFLVPVSGTYAFFLKLEPLVGQEQSLLLYYRDQKVGHVTAGGRHFEGPASTLVLLHAVQDDVMWVRVATSAPFCGSGASVFAGFLVQAD